MKEERKPRFGELLLEYGLITHEQLTKALNTQEQIGGRIGSILEELGYLDDDSLLSILSKQYNLPSVNLFEVSVSPGILNLLPYKKVKSFKVLPLKKADEIVSLAMVNPNDIEVIQDIEFSLNGTVKPFIVPSYQMDKAINYFEKDGYGENGFEGEKLKEEKVVVESRIRGTYTIYSLLKHVVDCKATDLHLTAGALPSVKINNELRRLSMPDVTPEQMREFASDVLTKEQMNKFERNNEIDFAISFKDIARFRVNMYKQRNSISLAARRIIEDIPSLEELNLPEWIKEFALKTQGLILIIGPAGHGKTTTLSAIVDVINSNRKCNIITLEDPIEYLHKHKKSNVNQREIGIDTESFAKGLKHIFRQDPDVIVIGEMRDPESIAIALTAAETGHLVISTMHTLNTTTAIDRIVDVFPGLQQHQVRVQFADVFLLIFGQRLVPRKDGKGSIVAHEKLANSFRIRNLIREGKSFNIRSLMQVASEDMSSIDHSLATLCIEGQITFEDGSSFADNSSYYQDIVKSART